MAQLPKEISNEQSESFQTILNLMDPLLLKGYHKFLHELIIQGISRHNLTLNTLSSCLFNLNNDAIDVTVQKAVGYYEMFAPSDIKSFEN